MLEIIAQRRLWAFMLASASPLLAYVGVQVDPASHAVIIDQAFAVASALSSAFAGMLALWSYLKPKPTR